VLGLALGVGVKRNVLNLYKFLCRNYNANDNIDDRIWAFGFSRGAFTVRVLAGLIYHEGLVSFNSEAELKRNALAAYRAYRQKAFSTHIPWVAAGRYLRDLLVSFWNFITGARSYTEVKKETAELNRHSIEVHFLGVWDTVVAYGLPIDELTRAVDQWVWPMKFRDDSLLLNVQHARHALSLDDERRTFHPIPWNESIEKERIEKKCVPEGRLRQVWFAGAHSDVGGGYPDDGLSFVPLCWMIDEAANKGLRFAPTVVAAYAAIAAPTGRIYDPRSGFGALWRYQPRDTQLLLGQGNTPLVHGSVMTRMAYGNDGYAPISLPETIDVLPPYGPPVAFNTAAVTQALALSNPAHAALSQDALETQRRVLTHTQQLAAAASAQARRADLFKLVLDTVWWRRVIYFVSLALVVIAVAFPLLAQYLHIAGVTDHLNDRAGGPAGWALGLIKGFVPGFAEPWITAVVRSPAQAAMILIALLASLSFSGFLQSRIYDRARAAWNVRMRVDGMALDRLRPTGQRHALAAITIFFLACAMAAFMLNGPPWLFKLFVVAAIVCGALWAFRRFRPAASVVPAKPGWLLGLSRAARTSPSAVRAYRYVAQTIAPFGFLVLSGLLALALVHRAVFDLLSTGGAFCQATPEVKAQSMQMVQQQPTSMAAGQPEPDEKLGEATFRTDSMCHATGLRLIAGRKYRIRLTTDAGVDVEWFDKGIRADVAGFSADSVQQYTASPLKRWWREHWFQPIARLGEVGNYEHVLRPVAPLPAVHFTSCRPSAEKPLPVWDTIKDAPLPASAEFKKAQLECEAQKGLRPNRVLISDITADATGELFLYVNDAVLTLPGLTNVFFRNNSGTAQVTVMRILATPVIEP
jgi:hypothetical protein